MMIIWFLSNKIWYFDYISINTNIVASHKYIMAEVCLGSFSNLLKILSWSPDRIHFINFYGTSQQLLKQTILTQSNPKLY